MNEQSDHSKTTVDREGIWSIEVYDAATDGHITDLALTPEQVGLLRRYLRPPVLDDDLIGDLHPVRGVVLFLGVRRP